MLRMKKSKRCIIDSDKILSEVRTKNDGYWEKIRRQNAIKLFHKVVKEVPAYSRFLSDHNIVASKIKTWDDFQNIPIVTKANYLKRNSLDTLCWKGSLSHPLVFTSTSGSTGEPYYFPRFEKIDREYSVLAELFLSHNKCSLEGPTLVVVCFGMGVWIGGLITYQAFEMASRNNHQPLSIITPGINKAEIQKILKKLAPNFKQTILIGYPPFIKDVIDEAVEDGVDLKKLNMRLMFAAEVFTEQFRDYLAEKTGINNVYLDTLNIYGTADIGAMAWESGISIVLKRLLSKDEALFEEFFPEIKRMPTIAQYNPHFITFEEENGEILLTANSALPLVRYGVGDHGGVMSFEEVREKLSRFGYDIYKEAEKVGVPKQFVYQLPFVYVYERNDFSTTLYGLQIYPEVVREVLLRKHIAPFVTGKFTMLTKFDDTHDQYLEINIELQKNVQVTDTMHDKILKEIYDNLCAKSSEFSELARYLGNRAYPKIVFWPTEDPTFFKPGIKQKWVQK